MYRVVIYPNATNPNGTILHEPNGYGNKIISGKVETSFNAVNTAEFVISYQNELYRKIEPIVNCVKVFDTITNQVIFDGRVSKIENDMSGTHTETITCEDCLAYLHDSIQQFMAINMADNSIKHFFETVVSVHNDQVETFKQFKIGQVDFETDNGKPVRYIDYKDTFETLKTRFIDMFGGYVTWNRDANGSLVINYLRDKGIKHESPIELGVNMKTAKRTLDVTDVATQLFPIGDNIEVPTDENTPAQDDTQRDPDEARERYTIKSVNNGLAYIVDEQLKGQFGVLGKIEEYQTKDPNVLLTYGWNYLQSQRVGLLTWDITVINFNLLNNEYDPFNLGDYYPIVDELLAGTEYLQVVSKEFNIVQPAVITLKFGNKNPSLTDYQQNLQSQFSDLKGSVRNVGSSVGGATFTATKASTDAQKASTDAQKASTDAKTANDSATKALTQSTTNTNQIANQGTKITTLQTNVTSLESRVEKLEKRRF